MLPLHYVSIIDMNVLYRQATVSYLHKNLVFISSQYTRYELFRISSILTMIEPLLKQKYLCGEAET